MEPFLKAIMSVTIVLMAIIRPVSIRDICGWELPGRMQQIEIERGGNLRARIMVV